MTRFFIIFFMLFQLTNSFYSENNSELFYSNVIRIARESVGMKYFPSIQGRSFTSDCIGFVRYVYQKSGLDLYKAYGEGRGGVSSLYDGLEKFGFVYDSKTALPGDLIFFDNTYDVNRNGKWDDPLSHIGIVTGYGKHGTIEYIHFGSGFVNSDNINLYYPNTHAFKQKKN